MYSFLALRFMKANRKYIEARDAITPVGRLNLVSSLLYKYSEYKPPFSSTFHSGAFLISNGTDSPTSVPLWQLRHCLLSAQQNFLFAIRDVLPMDFDLSHLPFHRIEDDFSAIPLHLQSHNKRLLEPYLTNCWTGVLQGRCPGGKALGKTSRGKWGLNHTEVDRWLEACGRCFSLACAPIFLSTGGANFSSLKHQQYAGQTRTVFLLKDGTLAFINPFPPHVKSDASLSLISVTPELTEYLLILLVIILPISTGLRTLKGQHHPYESTHIWVMYHKRPNGCNRWLFDEKHMDADLQAVSKDTFGFPLTCRALYHMVFGVLRKDFPGLFTDLSQDFMSPVDDLAQHRYLTGVSNYGRLTVFPKSRHLIGDQPWRHLEVCQLWQASLGCISVKDTWRKLIGNASLFNYLSLWQDTAFRIARNEVRYTYDMTSLSASQRSKHAVHILKTRPFLKGITVRTFGVFSTNDVLTKDQTASPSGALGDEALSSVIRTFLANACQKETEASALISAEFVADAATLVRMLISCISTNWLMHRDRL